MTHCHTCEVLEILNMFFSYTILEMCIDAAGSDLLIALVEVIYEQFVHKPAIVFMILYDLNVV